MKIFMPAATLTAPLSVFLAERYCSRRNMGTWELRQLANRNAGAPSPWSDQTLLMAVVRKRTFARAGIGLKS
ncbi:hypothetical protein EK904_013911 [Melospiza melodia maxima]|nr:hypothetical protein EK904_013911 [Melospiza melodia maxima]